MTHPYATLIDAEAKRAEDDLTTFRSRALTVLSTSSGMVTLLSAALAFAASKRADDIGIPGWAVATLAASMLGFVIAAVLALLVNAPATIDQPDLAQLASKAKWSDGYDQSEHERVAAGATAKYVASVRTARDAAGRWLLIAIGFQIAALAAAGLSAVITFASL